MHKGTIFVLTKDEEDNMVIHKSIEFKGDMELNRNGKNIIEKLKEVREISDFDRIIKEFNSQHYNYKNKDLTCIANKKSEYSAVKEDDNYLKQIFNIIKNMRSKFVDLSEYSYIKNMTDENIKIDCRNGNYILMPNQILVMKYAECINNQKQENDIQLDKLVEEKTLEDEMEM